jgi:hypothetical protein
LLLTLRPVYSRTEDHTVSILGTLHHWRIETEFLFNPILTRIYDRAEAHARQVLSPEEFDRAFAEGQKCSLDEALDLVLKMAEEM